jgi:hypothetical protein
VPGERTADLSLDVPAGGYAIEWMNPADLKVLASETIKHAGGPLSLRSPTHAVDIALRIRAC